MAPRPRALFTPLILILALACSDGPIAGKKAMGNILVYDLEMAKYIKAKGYILGDLYGAFLGHGFNYKNKSSVHYDAADPTLWFSRRGRAGVELHPAHHLPQRPGGPGAPPDAGNPRA